VVTLDRRPTLCPKASIERGFVGEYLAGVTIPLEQVEEAIYAGPNVTGKECRTVLMVAAPCPLLPPDPVEDPVEVPRN
jgi:hypothetical protein